LWFTRFFHFGQQHMQPPDTSNRRLDRANSTIRVRSGSSLPLIREQ
jgi:hypothetical protein